MHRSNVTVLWCPLLAPHHAFSFIPASAGSSMPGHCTSIWAENSSWGCRNEPKRCWCPEGTRRGSRRVARSCATRGKSCRGAATCRAGPRSPSPSCLLLVLHSFLLAFSFFLPAGKKRSPSAPKEINPIRYLSL